MTRTAGTAVAGSALEAKNSILRSIIDRAAVSLVVARMDGVVDYANKAFSAGFRFVARVGGPVRLEDLFVRDDLSADHALSLLLTGAAEDYKGEQLCFGIDGAPVRVAIEAYVLPSESDGPSYLIVQLVNIEGRKESEEALAASESRWKFALDGARQGVWDHDALRKTTFHAPMWHEIRGLSP